MALKFGANLRNDIAAAIATRLGATAVLKMFSGALPANCAASDPSGPLVSISLQNPAFAAASAVAAMAGTPSANASGTGVAKCFRIYDSAGSPLCQIQNYVAENWVISTAYVIGQQVIAGGNIYTCTTGGNSNSSGSGPTGTGTGITDGSCVWSFVEVASGLLLNSTSFTSGQLITLTSYSITIANS